MKIAVTTTGKDLDADLDPRFGRAGGFLIIDSETGEAAFLDNDQNLQAPQGAGIQAAVKVKEAGAKALLTGHCGPNAFKTLQAAEIAIYTGLSGTIRDILKKFKNQELTPTSGPDVEGHWV